MGGKWKKYPRMEIENNLQRQFVRNTFMRLEDLMKLMPRSTAYKLMRRCCEFEVRDIELGISYRVMRKTEFQSIKGGIFSGRHRGNPNFRDPVKQRALCEKRWAKHREINTPTSNSDKKIHE